MIVHAFGNLLPPSSFEVTYLLPVSRWKDHVYRSTPSSWVLKSDSQGSFDKRFGATSFRFLHIFYFFHSDQILSENRMLQRMELR